MRTSWIGIVGTLLISLMTPGQVFAQEASCQGASQLQARNVTTERMQPRTAQVRRPAKASAQSDSFWEKVGGPYGAKMTSMMSLSDSTLIAHTDRIRSATYRSTDNGDSWTRLSVSGRAVAKPPGSEKTAYIAGRDVYRAKLWRTDDRGATWKSLSFAPASLNLLPVGYFFDLAVSSDSTILAGYYGHEVGVHCPDTETALVRSEDGGQTWQRGDTYFDKLSLLATDDEGNVYVARDNHVFRLGDGGKTWNRLNQERTLFGNLIDFAAISPDTLFVLANEYNNNPTTYIHRSLDGGQTWQETGVEFQNARVLEVGPDGALYVGTDESVYYRTDAGNIFREVGRNRPEGVRALAFSEGSVFAGTKPGPYRLRDPDAAWTLQNEGMNRDITALAYGGNGTLYAGGRRTATTSTDGGATWETAFLPEEPSDIVAFSEGKALAVAGKIYRTIDQGRSWRQTGPDSVRGPLGLVEKSDGSFLAVNHEAVYRSTVDGGSSWELLATFDQYFSRVNGLSAPTNDTLYAATIDGVQRSTNGGRSWSVRSNGLPTHSGEAWTTKNVISTSAENIVAVVKGRIYHSGNSGASWTGKQKLERGDYETLDEVLIEGPQGILYAAGDDSIYVSEDGGRSWEQATLNPQGLFVKDLAIDRQGRLLAGTRRGIYRSREPVKIGVDDPALSQSNQPVTLHPNAPNPFRQETRLTFTIARSQTVTLVVYDVLGRRVATPLQETRLESGTHTIRFEGEGLASGMYVSRLQVGETVKTQRMMLVR